MVVNKWKVVAIICIILLILETSLIIWVYDYGTSLINNKIKCSNKICYNINSESFIYDEYSNTCYCYNGENIVHQEIVK